MASKFRHGKYGRIKVRGVDLNLKYWRIDPRGRSIDFTNFLSPIDADNIVYGESGVGIVRANIRVRGLLTSVAGKVPYLPPVRLKTGMECVPVRCEIVPGIGFDVEANVLGTPVETEVEQGIMVESELEVTGLIQYPTA